MDKLSKLWLSFAVVAGILLAATFVEAQYAPMRRLARGYILRGNSSNVGAPYDANGDGQVLVGDGTDLTSVAISGDVALLNTGATTVTDLTLTNEEKNSVALFDGTNWVAGAKAYTYLQGSWLAPVCGINTGGAATGATTTVTNCSLGYHFPPMVIYNEGANTTRIAPRTVVDANCTDGLEIASTNTDNVGGTVIFGGSMLNLLATAVSPTCYKVGTDAAFYMSVTLGIPDISEYDVLWFGFVEPAAAYVTGINTAAALKAAYDEKAGIGLADTAGDLHTYTSLAGSDTDTDLTTTDWVDDAVKTLEVYVSAAGVTTYKVYDAGVEDTSTGAAAFTFADTTLVCPAFIYAKAAANTDTPPIIESIEWGFQ